MIRGAPGAVSVRFWSFQAEKRERKPKKETRGGGFFLPIGYYELDPAAATPNLYRIIVLEYYTVRFKIIVYYY